MIPFDKFRFRIIFNMLLKPYSNPCVALRINEENMAKRILMIDDDPDDQLLFQLALKEIDPGIVVKTAENGLLGLQLIDSAFSPDLIVLDLNTPVLNGFEFLQRFSLNALFTKIPVVIYSTAGDSESIRKTKELGADAFISKPTDFKLLLLKVKKLLHHLPHLSTHKSPDTPFLL